MAIVKPPGDPFGFAPSGPPKFGAKRRRYVEFASRWVEQYLAVLFEKPVRKV